MTEGKMTGGHDDRGKSKKQKKHDDRRTKCYEEKMKG